MPDRRFCPMCQRPVGAALCSCDLEAETVSAQLSKAEWYWIIEAVLQATNEYYMPEADYAVKRLKAQFDA